MFAVSLSRTIFIIILILLTFLLVKMFSEMRKIQDNWDEYRCKPTVMPFAAFFGKNAEENFQYCLANSQKDLMGYFMAPMNQTFNLFAKLGDGILKDMQQIRGVIDWFRKMSEKFGFDLVGLMKGMVQIAIMTIMKIVDLIKKVIAMLYTVAMLLKSVMYWGESFWDNIPEPFCFKKDTPIQLRDGSWKSMHKANLGDVMLNGSEILGVLKLKNANREPYYKIYDVDLCNYIYVTGKHKIRYDDKFIYVKDYPYAEKTEIVDDELACLITNDHIINIGCHIFADWEIE